MMLILILYMLFASTFTIGKAVLDYTSPIFFIGIRMVSAGLLLLSYQYFFNKKNWRLSAEDLMLFGQLILFHVYIAFTTEYWALRYVSSGKACLMYNLSPFLTALFAYLVLKERMSGKKWLGLLLGFSGFIPILVANSQGESQAGMISVLSFGEVALLISVASSVYGWVIVKKLIKERGYSPIMVNGVAMSLGGLLALITSFALEGRPSILKIISPKDLLGQSLSYVVHTELSGITLFLLYTALLIIIANIICYNLYGYLLTRYSATFLSFVGFTTPLFAALFGWIFRGEKEIASGPFLLSVGIIFCGLFLFYQEELKENAQRL